MMMTMTTLTLTMTLKMMMMMMMMMIRLNLVHELFCDMAAAKAKDQGRLLHWVALKIRNEDKARLSPKYPEPPKTPKYP